MMRLPLQISLPVELYRPIVHNLEHNTTALLAIALASRELQLEAERFIYRSMALKSEVDQQKFLTCILECSRRASLVEMYSQDEVSYSGKFRLWSLLCNALNDMRNLKYLAIHTVLITDSPSEFHRRYSFRLSTLDLRGHCSGNTLVVTFLQQQTQLESLSIEWSEEEGYLIATSTCPRLRFLRGNKGAIETFLPGRSVCALAWAPHPADSSSCPTHLASAFNNLRTLSYGGIIGCPDLSLIIRYLQQLEILRIVDPIMNELTMLYQAPNINTLILLCQHTRRRYHTPPFVDPLEQVIHNVFSSCSLLRRIDISVKRSNYERWTREHHVPQTTNISYQEMHHWWVIPGL